MKRAEGHLYALTITHERGKPFVFTLTTPSNDLRLALEHVIDAQLYISAASARAFVTFLNSNVQSYKVCTTTPSFGSWALVAVEVPKCP